LRRCSLEFRNSGSRNDTRSCKCSYHIISILRNLGNGYSERCQIKQVKQSIVEYKYQKLQNCVLFSKKKGIIMPIARSWITAEYNKQQTYAMYAKIRRVLYQYTFLSKHGKKSYNRHAASTRNPCLTLCKFWVDARSYV
jgi:hypothetical protein